MSGLRRRLHNVAGEGASRDKLCLDKGFDLFGREPVVPDTVGMNDDDGPLRSGLVTVHQRRFDIGHEPALDELFPQRSEKFARAIFFAAAKRAGIDTDENVVAKFR